MEVGIIVNQEDSMIICKDAIERGLFRATIYKTTLVEEVNQGNQVFRTIQIPPPTLMAKNLSHNYNKLAPNGIIYRGSIVRKDDVLVGLVVRDSGRDSEPTDCSIYHPLDEEGVVDDIVITTNSEGFKLIKIRVAFVRHPQIADKFESKISQKGVLGLVMPRMDMPFDPLTGISPDIIINPHAMPSRMTTGQLIEMALGEHGAITGQFHDCTAYHTSRTEEKMLDRMNNVETELRERGYTGMGKKKLVNGMTGEIMESRIFMAMPAYQRLKHMVDD
jgi:DNA-directed RNA polymerase II subunit RPB2